MKYNLYLSISVLMLLTGCVNSSQVVNSAGKPTVYQDVENSSNKAEGIGIESQDIVSMVDRMMRDIISTDILVNRKHPPRVIIDSKYFRNESSSRINKNLITERLLVNLNRAAHGRMIFLEREEVEMVANERELKRNNEISIGNLGNADKIYGADYRLSGKIMSLDTLNNQSGAESRYHQISFKLVDLETGAVVWTNMYEFKKIATSNVIYR